MLTVYLTNGAYFTLDVDVDKPKGLEVFSFGEDVQTTIIILTWILTNLHEYVDFSELKEDIRDIFGSAILEVKVS